MTFQPPTQPAKKKSRKAIILGVVGGILALCCVGGTITAIASSSGKKPQTQSSPAAAPTTGAAAKPPATSQATAPPAAKTLLTVKGNGIKKSQIFTTGREWELTYTFDCASFGQQGNFQVTLYDGQGGMQDLLVNELAPKGSDTVPVHASAGAHYLEMNSECSWTVAVTG